ncbi:MAG: type II toxin-antitoxin system HipA family toxin [Legionellales bacterium]|nr:type II toxin-antitoxin system HipA family toxin [Legionellales bacterium]
MQNARNELNVFMNGVLIGTVTKKSATSLMFQYHKDWLTTAGARPISLSLPLTDMPFTGDEVYHFFDNLLPDNPQIHARIQAQFHLNTHHPFDLLAAIGQDCVGAIQLSAKFEENNHLMKYQPLTIRQIANILRNISVSPLGMSKDYRDFRISIAGAQEKTAFLFWQNTWNLPQFCTPTTHIFKLPIGYLHHQQFDLQDSCENEWICAQIVKAFGLPVAECEIKYFEDVKVLVVKRFDRKLSQDKNYILRLPQEDLCQALGVSSHLKYQADGGPSIKLIMKLLLGSKEPSKDREIFFSAQIIYWLLAAIDGHAKNFSIFLEADGQYQLTPLYDIMSAYPLLDSNQLQRKKTKMAMALVGKNSHYHWHEMTRRHFLSTAKFAGYSQELAEKLLTNILDKIDSVIDEVSQKITDDNLKKTADLIFAGLLQARKKLIISQ